MSTAEEIRQASIGMTAPDFLRSLLAEKFPQKTAVTASLRARSIVVLSMIAEIDPATRIIFCHAPDLYRESVEYRDDIISKLKLSNIRIAGNRPGNPSSETTSHSEDILSDVYGGDPVHSTLCLDQPLAGFDCWISAVYHRPYGDEGIDRVSDEQGLLRIAPLEGWSQEAVHAHLAERNLPLHPHIEIKQKRPSVAGTQSIPTYHY